MHREWSIAHHRALPDSRGILHDEMDATAHRPAGLPDVSPPRMKMSTVLDHLVVTAPTLERGAAFVHRHLGAMPVAGGKHATMGTHNLLLRLGETSYLEVIAVDPDAAPPSRPRWFGLDRLAFDAPASLAAWVARTSDIRSMAAHAGEVTGEDLGSIATMSRADLTWLITIPEDGRVMLDGCAPMLIEWQGDVYPASRLSDVGLRLVRLELHHPDPERLRKLFDAIDLSAPIDVVRIEDDACPHLVATIDTPWGRRSIATA